MRRRNHRWLPAALLVVAVGTAQGAADTLIAGYRQAGAGPFDAGAGAQAWVQEHQPAGANAPRSCATCHGRDLTRPGRHTTTGKVIEPMAPSVNPTRLSDSTKTERWLGRNCRWTLGRDCTAQEKGDFLSFIQTR